MHMGTSATARGPQHVPSLPHPLALACTLLLACTAHEPLPAIPIADPTSPAALARSLAIDLPAPAGQVVPRGPALWLGPEVLAFVGSDARLHRLDDAEIQAAMIGELYDLLAAETSTNSLDLFVDRRVTMERLVPVLYTAGRASRTPLRLVGGPPEQPVALAIELAPMFSDHPDAKPPFGRLAADLVVAWGVGGVVASARPRPAERAPFGLDHEEPAPGQPDTPPLLPAQVPLRGHEDTGLLDPPALARIAGDLCSFNDGPLGVSLAPTRDVDHAALMRFAAAIAQPCTAEIRLNLAAEATTPDPDAVTVAELATRLNALTRDHGAVAR